MPEQPKPVPFRDQLQGREFKPGDVIPVNNIEDFDVFATFVAQQLVEKQGGKFLSLFPNPNSSPSAKSKEFQELLRFGKRPKDPRFNGQFINPRIIINEPLELDELSMVGSNAILFPDKPHNGIAEQFPFTVAMDLYTSAGGIYKVPAQVACNLIVVSGGEAAFQAGNKEYIAKRIYPFFHAELRGVGEVQQAVRNKEIVSIVKAEAAERRNLAQGPLPGSFESRKRR